MSSLAEVSLRLEAARYLADVKPGIQIVRAGEESNIHAKMAMEVSEGLGRVGRKTLPCTYFYDKTGSALYEQITKLPEYYPTRCEAEILQTHAAELVELLNAPTITSTLVELGSGSSTKTRILLDHWSAKTYPVTYIPIDVSESMLAESAEALSLDYPSLQVMALAGRYEEALSLLTPGPERLFLFLGGTIGNFSPGFQNIFFMNLAKHMGPGAKLLIGFDRIPHGKKPIDVIYRAYNDHQQVTAAFNRNILAHINTELHADFRLSYWKHEAVYNKDEQQIEMYLESTRFQRVEVDALRKTYVFEPGERILTEISRKFDPDELIDWFEKMGYRCLADWTDESEFVSVLLLECL